MTASCKNGKKDDNSHFNRVSVSYLGVGIGEIGKPKFEVLPNSESKAGAHRASRRNVDMHPSEL